jgi:hypothetical protein
MLKFKDLHLGRVVLVNTGGADGTDSKTDNSNTQEKIGIVYKVDERNETCCIINCNYIDSKGISWKQVLQSVNGGDSLSNESINYLETDLPITSVELLPARLLFYSRKLSEAIKLLGNKEAAAAESDKFIAKSIENLNNANAKLVAKKADLACVIMSNGSGEKVWRLPRNYNYIFRVLFYPRLKDEIQKAEASQVTPFRQTMAVAYNRVVKGLRKLKQSKWTEIANLDGITYFARGNMLIEVVMSEHNNPGNDIIKYIYSSERTKYSWETRLGADFIILVGDGKQNMDIFPNIVKSAVVNRATLHQRIHPGRYFYQLVPTALQIKDFQTTITPAEAEWFSMDKNIKENMKIGSACIIEPGFETNGGGEFNFTKGHWRIADKITAQIQNHIKKNNIYNGRNRIGLYRKHSVYEFSSRKGVRPNRNGTAVIRSNKVVLDHPVRVFIDFCLNGWLWKNYNEARANKSAIEILNLDKQDADSTYYEYVIGNYKEILRNTSKLYDPTYKGVKSEDRKIMIDKYKAKLEAYGRSKCLEWFRSKAADCYEMYLLAQLEENKTSTTVPLQLYVQKQNLDEILQDLKKSKKLKSKMETYLNTVDECIIEEIRDEETEPLTVKLLYEVIGKKKFSKRYKGYRVIRIPSAVIRLEKNKVASYWQSKQFLHNAIGLCEMQSNAPHTDHFQNLAMVEEIDLRGHKIKYFPMKIDGSSNDFKTNAEFREKAKYLTLSHLSSLKILRLSKNLMVQMSTVFNRSLMYLDLSFNKLKKVPLLYCDNLKVLNVSNNELYGSLDDAMFNGNADVKFPILETLDLSGNKFTWGTEQVFSAFSILRYRTPKIQNLLLHENPFLTQYRTKKKLLLLRSTVCTALPKLLAFSPPNMTSDFELQYPPIPQQYSRCVIYSWTKCVGGVTRRWHGAYLGQRRTKESLYDTFEREEAFNKTQDGKKHDAKNFRIRFDFHMILRICEKPAIEEYIYRKMERGLIESGKDLVQWHNARTKRSHETIANEYDSNIATGGSDKDDTCVNTYTFKWKMVKVMSKMNTINVKRAFSLWSKVATSKFYYLRLYSKKRLNQRFNSSLDELEYARKLYYERQNVTYINAHQKEKHLLNQIITQRIENLSKIFHKLGDKNNIHFHFNKWKTKTNVVTLNARNIKSDYEKSISKRIHSLYKSSARYRCVLKRGFEKWKRSHILNQIQFTSEEVNAAKRRIKANQMEVNRLKHQMHIKVQSIDKKFAKVKDKLQEQDNKKKRILALQRQIALNQIESHSLSNQLDDAKKIKMSDDGDILAQTAKGITRYLQI